MVSKSTVFVSKRGGIEVKQKMGRRMSNAGLQLRLKYEITLTGIFFSFVPLDSNDSDKSIQFFFTVKCRKFGQVL